MAKPIANYWPEISYLEAHPFAHKDGRQGVLYFNHGQKEVGVRFVWKATAPECALFLWTKEGIIPEVTKPSLFGEEEGIEVSWKMPPGDYVIVVEKEGEDGRHSH